VPRQRYTKEVMPVNRARVFEQALALPEGDRLALAAELLASSPPPGILQADRPSSRTPSTSASTRSAAVRRSPFPRARLSRSCDVRAQGDDRVPPDALAEIERARDWYEDKRPGLGGELVDQVERVLERIEAAPTSFARTPESTARDRQLDQQGRSRQFGY